jgi:biotin operon repressor
VAAIHASSESGAAIARRLGIARQTVTKIRTGKTHQDDGSRLSPEEMVRLVLSQPPNWNLSQIAELTGISRDTVRKIRLGIRYPQVLSELPRMTAEESRRRCRGCVQWVPPSGTGREHRYGRCHLGIAEATETQTWARGCGAYMAAKTP